MRLACLISIKRGDATNCNVISFSTTRWLKIDVQMHQVLFGECRSPIYGSDEQKPLEIEDWKPEINTPVS